MTREIGIYEDPRKARPWVVRWFGVTDATTGKRKRYGKSFVTENEAKKYKATKFLELEDGEPRDTAEQKTLRMLCQRVLTVKKSKRCASRTLQLYESSCGRLMKHFGPDRVLKKIEPSHAQDFFTAIQSIKNSDRELSDWTRDKIFRTIRAIFRKGVIEGWIKSNPFNNVERPELELRDWQYITPQQYRNLLDATPSLRWQAIYSIAYTTGLRFAELFNLTWNEVNFEAGQIKVQSRATTDKLPPFRIKTKASERIVPVPEHTLNILRQLRLANALKSGPFVVLSERQYQTLQERWARYRKKGRAWESQLTVNNVNREFRRHLSKAGIEREAGNTLSFHTLRKCAGKNWADRIVNPKIVQVLMGHKTLETTMKFYNKMADTDMQKAADAIDIMLKSDAEVTPARKEA